LETRLGFVEDGGICQHPVKICVGVQWV
jgi:hypothetical protein